MYRTLHNGTALVRLSNGLRVIVSPRPRTDAMAIVLAVGGGSKQETLRTNGLTHFLEHMVFEGTEHYPNPSDLNRAIANVGGDFNAYTNVESTLFSFQGPDRGLLEAMCIVSDVVWHPLLNETEVHREREVVIEEAGEKADDPYDAMEDVFTDLLFPTHGLGLSITGTAARLARFRAKDLRTLHRRTYAPDNMVLCVATDRPVARVFEMARLVFGGMRGRAKRTPITVPPFTRDRLAVRRLDGRQAYATVGGRGPKWSSPDRYAMEVVMSALGGSMHSRLPMLLREALGEVYNIQSIAECFTEAGTFSTITDCRPTHLQAVLEQVIEGYVHLRTHPLSQDEIDLARHALVGESIVNLDQLAARAEFYAANLLLRGVFESPADIQARWGRVSHRDVERVVRTWISPNRLAVTCLGTVSRRRLASLLPS